MEFTLSAIMSIMISNQNLINQEVIKEQLNQACLVQETCQAVEREHGYYEIVYKHDTAPKTDKFKCVREKTCTAKWVDGQVVFDEN